MQHIGTTGMLQYFLKMFFFLYLPVYTRYVFCCFPKLLRDNQELEIEPAVHLIFLSPCYPHPILVCNLTDSMYLFIITRLFFSSTFFVLCLFYAKCFFFFICKRVQICVRVHAM